MSLINKMLEDIERSRPAADADLSTHIAAVRPAARSRMPFAVPVLAAIGGAAVAVVLARGLPALEWPSAANAPETRSVAPAPPEALRAVAHAPVPASSEPRQASTNPPAPPAAQATSVVAAAMPVLPEAAGKTASPKNDGPPVAATTLKLEPANAAGKPQAAASAPQQVQSVMPAAPAPAPATVAVTAAPQMPAAAALPVKTVSAQQQSENLYREAMVLVQQGRAAESTGVLEKALQVQPRNAAARKALAASLMQRGNTEAALKLLEEGRKLTPDDADLAVSVARVELERANAQRAHDLLDEVARAGKADAPARAMQAIALQRLGRHGDAVTHFVSALQANPMMPNWLVGLGISLRASGRDLEAVEAFERASSTGLLSSELAAFVEQQLRGAVRQDAQRQ